MKEKALLHYDRYNSALDWSVMQYLMAPLDEHFDDGFGAIGEAFRRAAQALKEAGQGPFFEQLPLIFLLRHAIELFLKSGIIIIHRKLKLPYDKESYKSTQPQFQTESGKWLPLFSAAGHDLLHLYPYWKKLLTEHKEALIAHTRYKPDMSVPSELDKWIAALANVDRRSDYFRYPISKNITADKEKSPFKETPLENLFPDEVRSNKKVRALVTKNAEGEWLRAFALDESTLKELGEAAWNAAEMLNNFHAMMRIELTGGW